ncbi:hypothetical protein ACX9R5_09390 [Rathayibacter sp. CAU 1779]
MQQASGGFEGLERFRKPAKIEERIASIHGDPSCGRRIAIDEPGRLREQTQSITRVPTMPLDQPELAEKHSPGLSCQPWCSKSVSTQVFCTIRLSHVEHEVRERSRNPCAQIGIIGTLRR